MTLGLQEFLRRFFSTSCRAALSASVLSASSLLVAAPDSCCSASACSTTTPRRTHPQPSLLPPLVSAAQNVPLPCLFVERFSVIPAWQLSNRSALLDSS